jgi:hypothetical protein
MTVTHYLTIYELLRVVDNAPGNEALADLLAQMPTSVLRVDLDKLLRKPDETKGSLPPP